MPFGFSIPLTASLRVALPRRSPRSACVRAPSSGGVCQRRTWPHMTAKHAWRVLGSAQQRLATPCSCSEQVEYTRVAIPARGRAVWSDDQAPQDMRPHAYGCSVPGLTRFAPCPCQGPADLHLKEPHRARKETPRPEHDKKWRRGRDSNPRQAFARTRFPSELLKPLGHPSA